MLMGPGSRDRPRRPTAQRKGWPARGRALRRAVAGATLACPGLAAATAGVPSSSGHPDSARTGGDQRAAPTQSPALSRRSARPSRQAGIVDAGSFTIFRGSAKIGREEFTIRMAPPPEGGFLASGTIVYADRRLTPALGTDSAGAPQRYQVEVRAGDRRTEVLSLEIVRGHGSTRVQTARGESATEFVVPAGTRLIDDDVFSHYFFLARTVLAGQGRAPTQTVTVPILVPRGAVVPARVTTAGEESVDVAGRSISATRVHVTLAAGDERELWADAAGRVIKVAIPARGIIAVRDDAPR
jgi:hypothetical protein